ncbi:MAG: zinc ribbon domain-containing protein [Halanaerobiaceae bacterium]
MPLLWFVFCGLVAYYANRKGRNAVGWGLLAIFISPLLAGIALAIAGDLSVEKNIDNLNKKTDNLEREIKHNKDYNDINRDYMNQKVEQISSSNQKQKVLSEGEGKNKSIEDKIKCNNCNEYINMENKFCPLCGERVITDEQQECPQCGNILDKSSKFCNKCGQKLKASCSSCNKEYDLGIKYCPDCGGRLKNSDVISIVKNNKHS